MAMPRRIVATLTVLLAGTTSGDQLTEAELQNSLASVLERMAALEKSAASEGRVALLEADNFKLQRRLRSGATATAGEFTYSGVSPVGGPTHEARQLLTTTCCRWTHDATCGEVEAARYEKCTGLHEYLEGKTTTHVFADLDACMGTNVAGWTARFDGPSANVLLYKDGTTPVASWPTPLKVTHDASCATNPPVLTVQHQTVHELGVTVNGNLNVADAITLAGATVAEVGFKGFDKVGSYIRPPARSGYGTLRCRGTQADISFERDVGGEPKQLTAKDLCLRLNDNDNEAAIMETCNLDHGEKMFTPYGKMLRNRHHRCAIVNETAELISSSACNNDDGFGATGTDARAMYFEFDGEQIKTNKTGNNKCMQCGRPVVGQADQQIVRMADCTDEGNQQWCAPAPVPASLGSPPTHPQRHLTTPHRYIVWSHSRTQVLVVSGGPGTLNPADREAPRWY